METREVCVLYNQLSRDMFDHVIQYVDIIIRHVLSNYYNPQVL